jgi:hypothetical protein
VKENPLHQNIEAVINNPLHLIISPCLLMMIDLERRNFLFKKKKKHTHTHTNKQPASNRKLAMGMKEMNDTIR